MKALTIHFSVRDSQGDVTECELDVRAALAPTSNGYFVGEAIVAGIPGASYGWTDEKETPQ
jgi:hypothetical protein